MEAIGIFDESIESFIEEFSTVFENEEDFFDEPKFLPRSVTTCVFQEVPGPGPDPDADEPVCRKRSMHSVRHIPANIGLNDSTAHVESNTKKHNHQSKNLESVPHLLNAAFNSADLCRIRQLVNTYFDEHCEFSTNALDAPLRGRHHIIEYHRAFLKSCPDATTYYNTTSAHASEIRSDIYFSGTHIFHHPTDSIFDILSKSQGTESALAEAEVLKRQGKKYEMYGKGIQHYYFSSSGLRFGRVVFDHFVHEVHECVDMSADISDV